MLPVFICLPAARGEPGVEILRPRHLATVVGPTIIELRVEPPDGLSAERVEVRVDGRLLATLTAPPWTVSWDAGDASTGHALEAIAHLSGGASARSSIRTSPLQIHQVEKVDLVNLYPVVKDRKGGHVAGLAREDFRIYENGVLQTIERFSAERKPLRVGIVLDTSATMGRGKGAKLKNAQSAALAFLGVLRPGDEGMVVTFADSVNVVQDLTSDVRLLAQAIEQVTAAGGTALYDAIWQTATRLQDFDGRRVMVLLSDGKDEAYNGLEPGSLHTVEEALDNVLRSEVTVFAIGLGNGLESECVFSSAAFAPTMNGCPQGTVADTLRRVADSSGGRTLISPGANRLREAFEGVAEDLRNQYSIAYSPMNTTRDIGFRPIQVAVVGRDVEVIARAGYYISRRPHYPVSSKQ